MRIKLLTFRYSSTLGGLDDRALSEFIRDKDVIAFREHFYAVNEVPHLSCVIHYQDAVVPMEALRAAATAPPAATTTTLRPDSGAALGTVDGVGSGKIERFGRGLLAALHGAPPAAAPASAEPIPGVSEAEASSDDPPARAAVAASVESAELAGEDA